MTHNIIKLHLLFLLLGLGASQTTLARDVSNEQYVVTAAQKNYDNAKAAYDASTDMLNDQKQRVAQDQAILKERQKEQATAKAQLTKAQALLEKRQKELNSAWNKGNH